MLTAAALLFLAIESTTFADVEPIFLEKCSFCHSGPEPAAKLSLDTLDALKKGGESGPVAVSGDPGSSEIVLRVRGKKKPRMPLDDEPLSVEEIARIEAFVAGGLLPAPGDAAPPAEPTPTPRPAPKPGEKVAFADVEPVFKKRCVKCHMVGGERESAPEDYLLGSWEEILSRRERVRVVPTNPLASEVVRRIRGLSRPRMPFGDAEPLSDVERRLVETWIAQGAPGPDGKPAPIPAGAEVRLRGRLTAPSAIDGLEFAIDAGTRVDKRPSIGDEAELRGVVLPDGRIRATRLRRR